MAQAHTKRDITVPVLSPSGRHITGYTKCTLDHDAVLVGEPFLKDNIRKCKFDNEGTSLTFEYKRSTDFVRSYFVKPRYTSSIKANGTLLDVANILKGVED